jgi:hypothetical protein
MNSAHEVRRHGDHPGGETCANKQVAAIDRCVVKHGSDLPDELWIRQHDFAGEHGRLQKDREIGSPCGIEEHDIRWQRGSRQPRSRSLQF